jgi:hypothetical protein
MTLSPTHLVCALATAGVVAAIALTPTASSNAASDGHGGAKKPDVAARHGRVMR